MTWLGIIAYLFCQLVISFVVSRNIKSESDYFVAGRHLGLFLVSTSLFATWYGAETCIGSAGAVYEQGLSGSRADPFGYSICLVLMGLFLAVRFWKGKYITLADFYRERFGGLVEKLAVWILFPSSLIWAAAQVRAFGQVIASTTPLPVEPAIVVSGFFVIAYTFLGGLMGDVITDLVQESILIIGLILLLVFALQTLPDLGTVFAQMAPERLSFIAPDENLLQRFDRWLVPILGSLVAQEAVSRMLAARTASVSRNACFVACGIYLVMGGIPVFLGLLGPELLPGLAEPEQFLSKLGEQVLPPVLFVVFSGALIAAILSTIDSILLAIGALISHNVVVPFFNLRSDKSKMLSARIVVIIAGILAFTLALKGDSVYDLVEAASSFGTAGIFVVTMLGMFTPYGQRYAAAAALVVGVVITPLCKYVWETDAPFLYSIICSGLAYAVVATGYQLRPAFLRFPGRP